MPATIAVRTQLSGETGAQLAVTASVPHLVRRADAVLLVSPTACDGVYVQRTP